MRKNTSFITIKMKRPGKGTTDCIKRDNGTKGSQAKETEGIGNDDMNLDRDGI